MSRRIRVVLTGSESTGKTTLATALAAHYEAVLVPEFVRGFAETLGRPIDFSDHGAIARGQVALEDAALEGTPLADEHALIIQDTDLLSTVVYCRHYFGRCPPWIEEAAAARRPHLYLLCHPDLPWDADGVRDRGERREEMHALFADAVRASAVPMQVVRGAGTDRLAGAVTAIDAFVRGVRL
jgi:NadR type nicotinamide-nucleotide adenylyltransferase